MKLKVDETFQQAIVAHKEGKLKEAEDLYRVTLKIQPLHADAKHNLGIIALHRNQSGEALLLFKTAIENNPKIEHFWINYIDTLIKERQFEDVKRALKKGKKSGLTKNNFNLLFQRLMSATNITKPSHDDLKRLLMHFQNGRYEDAEKLAISITKQFPTSIFGWKVLGGIFNQTGRISKALIVHKKTMKIAPQDPEVHLNFGNTLKELGKLEEAEASYKKALILKSDYAEANNNLGIILQQLGKLEEAEAIYNEAIIQKPDFAEPHYNLGIILNSSGRLGDAETSFKKAIDLKPNYAQAHNNLGATLQELGRFEEAEANFKRAISINPNFDDAYYNLGVMMQETGKLGYALECYKQTIRINSNHAEAYYKIANLLESIKFKEYVPGISEIICQLLDKETFVRPKLISKAIISLLKFDPIIKSIIKKHSAGNLQDLLQETLVDLSNIPLLLKIMKICPLPDLQLEAVFKSIRSAILLSISKIKNNSEILIFQIALSSQCFTNEYLYDKTDLEIISLQELEILVEKKLNKGEQPKSSELACLSSYKTLHEYPWIHLLSMPIELEYLKQRQILEPAEEISLSHKIPMLQEINNNISCKVRDQYEQNPYPRWVNLGLPFTTKSISSMATDLKLKIKNLSINEINNPQILIAGCGTGQQSIGVSSTYNNCDVLAVDLSLSSLAYAKRKTEELGISNIEYMQADILDLSTLNQKFDIIESVGVLHHMDDPMSGWKVLKECLKPGGLMRIGLYSELARQSIVQTREEIRNLDIDSSDGSMRSFRKKIVGSEEEHHKLEVLSLDFYSMSTFRDLLFHTQEHRFTIIQIKDYLSQLGLVFCGFESDEIIKKFMSENLKENAIYDLEKWDDFEKQNPRIFAGMYQFWCQRI